MSDEEREKWDRRYAEPGYRMSEKAVLSLLADELPRTGRAVDLACGEGQTAVFLAKRGLDVVGVDVSAVGLDKARRLADLAGVGARFVCADLATWEVFPCELVTCLHFLDRDLVPRVRRAVVPGGCVLLEMLTIGLEGGPRRYLCDRGELLRWFVDWEVRFYRESGGIAQLLAVRPG